MEINQLLNEKLILLDLQSTNKLDAISEMAEVLYKEGKLFDKACYLQAVLKREEEFSTGIGMGIATPHGKSSAVKEAALVFAKSKFGVDFASIDGNPAYLFFLIAVPEEANNTHLRILSELSRRLMHEDVRKKLSEVNTTSEVITLFSE
ncbi:MAG: PTS sugar transporter subunit IIA [Eubacteriales bacterium]